MEYQKDRYSGYQETFVIKTVNTMAPMKYSFGQINSVSLHVSKNPGPGVQSGYVLWWHGQNEEGTFVDGQLYINCEIAPVY